MASRVMTAKVPRAGFCIYQFPGCTQHPLTTEHVISKTVDPSEVFRIADAACGACNNGGASRLDSHFQNDLLVTIQKACRGVPVRTRRGKQTGQVVHRAGNRGKAEAESWQSVRDDGVRFQRWQYSEEKVVPVEDFACPIDLTTLFAADVAEQQEIVRGVAKMAYAGSWYLTLRARPAGWDERPQELHRYVLGNSESDWPAASAQSLYESFDIESLHLGGREVISIDVGNLKFCVPVSFPEDGRVQSLVEDLSQFLAERSARPPPSKGQQK